MLKFLLFLAISIIFNTACMAVEPLRVNAREVRYEEEYQRTEYFTGLIMPRRQTEAGFAIAGVLHQVMVDEGDDVEEGEFIALLDQELMQAEHKKYLSSLKLNLSDVEEKQIRLKQARDTWQRVEPLFSKGLSSHQEHDEVVRQLEIARLSVDKARAAVDQTQAQIDSHQVLLEQGRLKAPFNAVVTRRLVDEGAYLAPGQAVLQLQETDHLEAHIGVPLERFDLLNKQQQFELTVNNQTYPAQLKSAVPLADERSQTVRAIFSFEPLDAAQARQTLLPGQLVLLKYQQSIKEKGVWLPLTALARGVRGLWNVYSLQKDNEERYLINVKACRIVHTETERVFVQGTLNAGELIVSTGLQRLVPGQHVRIK